MRHTKIAQAKPFEGAARIHLPEIFGASPMKPFLLKVPVTGQRPVTVTAAGLPDGLALENGIITGKAATAGEYTVTFRAENALGSDEATLQLTIAEGAVLRTPLMGFTSWNAFGADVTQEKITGIARRMTELGITEYGYRYINTDSGWQDRYGGEFDAIQPNYKFPDMKKMCGDIHALGLKCGIYSTPMLHAWGCPKEFESIPGGTQGEADIRYSKDYNGGIGVIHKDRNNAQQWAAWGFDYLKYDWKPTDPTNAELMRQELIKTGRDFGFCCTVNCLPDYHDYWENYCNSYRNGPDSHGEWENLLEAYSGWFQMPNPAKVGSFFDLDMLDTGSCDLDEGTYTFTEDEQLVSYSLRAFLASPIQISSKLDPISEFELSMYCNEEIIAINQDALCAPARPVLIMEKNGSILHILRRRLKNGDDAYMVLNLGDKTEQAQIDLEESCAVRDVWAKEDMGQMSVIKCRMQPHTVRIFRVKK